MINAILSLFGARTGAPAEPPPARPFEGVLTGLIPGWTGEAEGQRRPAGAPEAAAAAPELIGLGIRLRADWARTPDAATGADTATGALAEGAPEDAGAESAGAGTVVGSAGSEADGSGVGGDEEARAIPARPAVGAGSEVSADTVADGEPGTRPQSATGKAGTREAAEPAGPTEERANAASAAVPAPAGTDRATGSAAGEGTAAASTRLDDSRRADTAGSTADRSEDTDSGPPSSTGPAAAAVGALVVPPGRTDIPAGQGTPERATEEATGQQGGEQAAEQSTQRAPAQSAAGGRAQHAQRARPQSPPRAPEQGSGRTAAGDRLADGPAAVAEPVEAVAPRSTGRPARPVGAPASGRAWEHQPATGDRAASDSSRAAAPRQPQAVDGPELVMAAATEREPRSSAAESGTAGRADGARAEADGQARARADIAASARAFARSRTAGKESSAGEGESRRPGSAVGGVTERRAGRDEAEAGPSSDRRPLTVDGAARRGPGATDPGTVRSVEPVRGPDAAGRVETIDALREQEARQPLHRVSVRVGEGESATRVRVNLRGDMVQSEMATESERLATRLGRELPELNRALRSQGLETDALRVRHGDRMVATDMSPTRTAASTRSGGESHEQMNQRSGNQHEPHDGRRRHREHSNEEGNE